MLPSIAPVLTCLAVSWAVAAMSGAVSGPLPQQPSRVVYVSVTDKNGATVPDMMPADFEVKVSGKTQPVMSVKPAQASFRVAMIVSDAGTGAFQASMARFMRKLQTNAKFALTSVIVQPEIVVDYTNDGEQLNAGIRRLGPRGRQVGAQLMEAILETTKTVRAEGERPVIVVMRVGGEATTPLSGDDVKDELRKSGALMYVISTVGAERRAASAARQGISSEQAQMHDDENVSGALNLSQVLGDGSKESGGRHEQVISTTLIPTLEQIADELLNQYAITYAFPDKAKPLDKLQVSSKRKGVTVRAPARVPPGVF